MKAISYQKNYSITSFLSSNKINETCHYAEYHKITNGGKIKKSIQFFEETLSKPLNTPSIN